MSRIGFFLRESWLLMVAAVFFGLLLSLAQGVLMPRIQANEQHKLDTLMRSLLSEASLFKVVLDEVAIEAGGKSLTTPVYQGVDAGGRPQGFAFIAQGAGFADKIRLVIALDRTGTRLKGYRVLSSNETPGFGDKIHDDYYRRQFIGAPAGPLTLSKVGDPEAIDDTIVAISGATVSSTAVVNIFNSYIGPLTDVLREKGLIQ